MTNAAEKADALLECWYLGQESGTAVAEVLLGQTNPSGKLPITIPRSVGHLPAFYNHRPSARRGYLFDEVTPLYPFGYGLSYTHFSFTEVKLAKDVIRPDEVTVASVRVENAGTRPGVEVVQMYIRDRVSSVTRPVLELKGFARVQLEPGQSEVVQIPIRPEHLSFWNIDLEHLVEPGEFDVMLGPDSTNLQAVTLTVTPK